MGSFRLYGGLLIFVGHFQKEQIGKLFQIIAIAYTVVAQGIAEAPDFTDNARCIISFVAHDLSLLLRMLTMIFLIVSISLELLSAIIKVIEASVFPSITVDPSLR